VRLRTPKDGDSASGIKSRAAKKLNIQDNSQVSALYEWHLVRYALDDGELAVFGAVLLNGHVHFEKAS
jgi:hypothetical protein